MPFLLERGFQYVAPASLELAVSTSLTLNSQRFTCFCLTMLGLKCMCHRTWSHDIYFYQTSCDELILVLVIHRALFMHMYTHMHTYIYLVFTSALEHSYHCWWFLYICISCLEYDSISFNVYNYFPHVLRCES